jgi:uncharacterized protein YjdB
MSVTIMPKTANVKIGATQHLTATSAPAEPNQPQYTVSGNAGGAVDAQGNYVGKRAGNDTVTVRNAEGDTDTSTITVAA